MTDRTDQPAFIGRFAGVRSALRRAEALHGLFWVLLVAACGLALLAAADYLWELPWLTRALGLGGIGSAAAIVALRLILSPWLWWSRTRTAIEIEERFPQLGQRVRTVLQFSGRAENEVSAEGVAPALVWALEEDTDIQSQPLDLGAVLPRRKVRVAAALAVLPILLLVGAASWDWQWRLAICRALLGDRPYTELTVSPGSFRVDEGQDAAISVKVTGRTNKRVILHSRPVGDAEASWNRRELPSDAAQPSGQNALGYETALEDVRRPMEYWVTAGLLRGKTHRIDVRYPIAIEDFDATLTPPAYTALEPSTVEGGDLNVIEGTTVQFQVELDRPAAEAALIFAWPPYLNEAEQPEPATRMIPLEGDGTRLSAELEFHEDRFYLIVARAEDGTQLAENRYHVRVRKDQPPQIRFEDPDEALEVHPIAEVLMRVRADDDFGLSKAGIVFQVDNRQEQTLLLTDFPTVTEEFLQPELALTTRTMLEEMLLLEDHDLSPTQAITYYAFAEDNFPDGARRTETDLRFIDVREFKRLYKVGGT